MNFIDLDYGITCIDTGYGRPGQVACYLLQEGDKVIFIDTGTFHSVPNLLEALDKKKIDRERVAYVMPTHVHLDHAGGAGELMRQLPNAKLVMHPRGARHMIDPSKLLAGAVEVYGETEFEESFGKLIPVAEDRVIIADDGFYLELNGRTLVFLDTPGHARHHYSIYDEKSKGIFAGDTFGISYREFDTRLGSFIFPPTTPVQFDPDTWHKSIDLLLGLNPERMYLTHYSMVSNVEKLADDLHYRIDRFARIAMESENEENRYQAIRNRMHERFNTDLIEHDCRLDQADIEELLALDLDLNTQGLEIWLDRNK
jgi:glyoxylase-like metal-dependent hydrolase (beta-lactamase superfamily II)